MGSNSKTDVAAAAWATPRVGTRRLLATTNYPNFFNFFFFNLPLNSKKNNCRDGRVQDQAELPRGLRGLDQQADQHGILCLVRLSFHGKNKHDMNFTFKIKQPLCRNKHLSEAEVPRYKLIWMHYAPITSGFICPIVKPTCLSLHLLSLFCYVTSH